ncbi:lipase maturation factor family protein, partial [Streptomyces sp. SID6013]|nr:lipase maturation factor family protein [Streptomyces sp. SID6013]
LFAPHPVSTAAAALMIATQLWLVLSGNFSWLNWITIVLALSVVRFPADPPATAAAPLWYEVVVLAVAALLVFLSHRPVRNMISRRQVMNRSFDALHLVNTYGAFGSVSRVRYEVVIEGTADEVARKDGDWREYEFRGKPGDPRRWPRQFAPYHLRLDWLMWFAALSPSYAGSWFGTFVERLLENDRATLRLLRGSPFPPDAPPRFVRARLFRYRYTTWRELRETGACWERTYVREYLPPTRLTGAPDRS